VRLNLQNVPVDLRPEQAELDPDDMPEYDEWLNATRRRRPSPARTES
jgi:hypothetical protein